MNSSISSSIILGQIVLHFYPLAYVIEQFILDVAHTLVLFYVLYYFSGSMLTHCDRLLNISSLSVKSKHVMRFYTFGDGSVFSGKSGYTEMLTLFLLSLLLLLLLFFFFRYYNAN